MYFWIGKKNITENAYFNIMSGFPLKLKLYVRKFAKWPLSRGTVIMFVLK
jgi:hypothetical protein